MRVLLEERVPFERNAACAKGSDGAGGVRHLPAESGKGLGQELADFLNTEC
jgi:hypothetical protein